MMIVTNHGGSRPSNSGASNDVLCLRTGYVLDLKRNCLLTGPVNYF